MSRTITATEPLHMPTKSQSVRSRKPLTIIVSEGNVEVPTTEGKSTLALRKTAVHKTENHEVSNELRRRSQPQVFTVTKTFRRARRPSFREDIDMKEQLKTIYEARRDGMVAKDWKAYETTFADCTAHIAFLKMLLNESERQYVHRTTSGNTGARHRTAVQEIRRRNLHRILEHIGNECEAALNEDDRLYTDYLSKIAGCNFFLCDEY